LSIYVLNDNSIPAQYASIDIIFCSSKTRLLEWKKGELAMEQTSENDGNVTKWTLREGMAIAIAALALITCGAQLLAVQTLRSDLMAANNAITAMKATTVPHNVKEVMARKHYYANKAWAAGLASDWQAANWYVRQVERMAESVAQANVVNDNGLLGQLERDMLLPRIEPIYAAIDNGDLKAFSKTYREMIVSCNGCHAATEHDYIRVAVPGEGTGMPNQIFEPSISD
jgi:hypothetical protein